MNEHPVTGTGRAGIAYAKELPRKPTEKQGLYIWPKIAFGEEGQEGLSIVGRADLRVNQWRQILKEHEKIMPDAVPVCYADLAKANCGP